MILKAASGAFQRILGNLESFSVSRSFILDPSASLSVLMKHFAMKACLRRENHTSSYLLQEISVALDSPYLPLWLALGALAYKLVNNFWSSGPAGYSNLVVTAFLSSLYNSPMGLVHGEIGGKTDVELELRKAFSKSPRNLPGFMVH